MLVGRVFHPLGIRRICDDGVRGLSQQGFECLRGVHVFVDVGYVLLEMLPDLRKLGSVDANHSKFIDLAR